MSTIYNYPPFQGLVLGVELEIEAEGLYEKTSTFDEDSEEYIEDTPDVPVGWTWVEEHSICGPELVLSQPLNYSDTVEAINRVYRDVSRLGYAPVRTPRGSTHVHVNVSDLTYQQLQSFVMTCAWVEPALMELAGPGRKGNLFVLPYEVAPLGWMDIVESIKQQRLLMYQDTHYMAINFAQIAQRGSVEFRMGPSARNAEEAVGWVSVIYSVAQAGRTQLVTDRAAPEILYELVRDMPAGVQAELIERGRWQAEDIGLMFRLSWQKQSPIPTPTFTFPPAYANTIDPSIAPQVEIDFNEFINGSGSTPTVTQEFWETWTPSTPASQGEF